MRQLKIQNRAGESAAALILAVLCVWRLPRALGLDAQSTAIASHAVSLALAAGLSLLLFRGQIIGVREGTVISALLTGLVVEYFVRRLSHPLTAVLTA